MKGINMEETILYRLKTEMSKLTPSQQKVASYILKNSMEVSFFTVEHLASQTRVSVATVMRLAYSLGYSGYVEFQKELQDFVLNETSPPSRLAVNIKKMSNNKILVQCAEKQIQNIQKTIMDISDEQAEEAIELILKAKKVYVIGLRTSSPTACYLEEGLNRIGVNSELLIPESSRLQSLLAKISEDSLLISIALPRYAKKTIEITQIAYNQGAKILAITDSDRSPLAKMSNVFLSCSYESLAFHNSALAATFIADYLVTATALKEPEKSKEELERIEKIVTLMKANLYK